jgi:nondiscriminating aspartyl-tRNA synthetase
MTTEGMEHYLMAFQYGLPPHGGLGIGLERFTMKLVGDDNVRCTTLFPRDMSRLEP